MEIPKQLFVIKVLSAQDGDDTYRCYALGARTHIIFAIKILVKKKAGEEIVLDKTSEDESILVNANEPVRYSQLGKDAQKNVRIAVEAMVDRNEEWYVKKVNSGEFDGCDLLPEEGLKKLHGSMNSISDFVTANILMGIDLREELIDVICTQIQGEWDASDDRPIDHFERLSKQNGELLKDNPKIAEALKAIKPAKLNDKVITKLKRYSRDNRRYKIRRYILEGLENNDQDVIDILNPNNLFGMDEETYQLILPLIEEYGNNVETDLGPIKTLCLSENFEQNLPSVRNYSKKYGSKANKWYEAAITNPKGYRVIQFCLASAVAGNPRAQLLIAELILDGRILDHDRSYKAAARWCMLSREGGNKDAKKLLDWENEYYPTAIKSFAIQIENKDRLKTICETGLVNKDYLKGYYYESENNLKKAYDSYKKASKQGDIKAKEKLDNNYEGLTDEEAFRKMSLCRYSGSAEILYALGVFFMDGRGTSQSYKMANKCFEEAAEKGEKKSIEMLDWNGDCKIADNVRFKKYALAKERGITEASRKLIRCYIDGIGTSKSVSNAIKEYDCIEKELDKEEQYEFAILLKENEEYAEDVLNKCKRLLQKSANEGYEPAIKMLDYEKDNGISAEERYFRLLLHEDENDPDVDYKLAICYRDGAGTEEDLEEYDRYLKRSAEEGNPAAQYEYGMNERDDDWLYKAACNGYVDAFEQLNPNDAFSGCNKSAKAGYVESYVWLARFYEEGHGTRKDLKKALEWYRKASDEGIKEAKDRLDPRIKDKDKDSQFRKLKLLELNGEDVNFELSEAYELGIGTIIDLEKAEEYVEKAANSGDERGQLRLAEILEKGKKYHQALEWYREAAEKGNEEAKERLDLDHLTSKTKKRQFENLMLYSEENDPQVLYYIGRCFEQGIGTRKDLKKALKFIEDSSEKGYPDALYWIGEYCEIVHDSNYSYKRALDCYRKAAEKGHGPSIWKLDWTGYEELTPEDKFKKCILYSVERDTDIEKQYELARCYELGIGTQPNESKAITHYEIAAKGGHAKSLYWMARMCEKEHTSFYSYEKAVVYYTKAAALGIEEAKERLDWSNYNSLTDEEKFSKCLLFSESRMPECLCALARCYRDGTGTVADIERAESYFQKAAYYGNVEAKYELARIKEDKKQYRESLKLYRECSEAGMKDAKEHIDISDLDGLDEWTRYQRCLLYSLEEDGEILYHLGRFYEDGSIVEQDYNVASRYYKDAVLKGSDKARNHIDLNKLETLGKKEQLELLLLHLADDQSEIFYKIGLLYDGGVTEDSINEKAFEYFEKAANMGHIDSCYRCGEMIRSKSVNGSMSRSLHYLLLAEQGGIKKARLSIGSIHYEGLNNKPNYREAAKWYRLAASDGEPDGEYMTGLLFEKGLGLPKFYAEAIRWYKLATKQRSFLGKFRLALLMYKGLGTKKDERGAISLLKDLKRDNESAVIKLIWDERNSGDADLQGIMDRL